jgi:hypothetical protein
MGGAPDWASRALSLFALGLAALGVAELVVRPRAAIFLSPFAPLYGLALLGCLQVLPLPLLLHQWLAPGSAAVWHPADPVAAAVLGPGLKPLSVFPAATLRGVAWLLGLAALASVAGPALRELRWARKLALAAIAGGLFVAVYGIVARVAYGPRLFGFLAVPTVSPFGPFVSKNHFAAYVGALALVSLGFAVGLADAARRDVAWLSWVRSPRAAQVVLAFGASLVLVLAVLVAQSRGGALGLGAGVAAFLLLRLSRGGRLSVRGGGLVVLLGAASVLLVMTLLPSEARSRLSTLAGSPDPSGTFRLGVWKDALMAFRASPWLGHGLGAFEDALPPHKTVAGELRVEHAENDFLEILVDAGLVAGALVAWGIALLVRSSRAALGRRGLERGLALGAAAAVVGLAVHSLVDFPLRLPAVASAFVVVVSLSCAVGEQVPTGAPLTRSGAIAGFAVLLAFWVHVLIAAPLAARAGSLPGVQRAIRSGIAGPAPSRARTTAAELRLYLQSRPGDAEAWALLAWLRAREGDRAGAVALARHAVALDPRREALQSYARSLEEPAAR